MWLIAAASPLHPVGQRLHGTVPLPRHPARLPTPPPRHAAARTAAGRHGPRSTPPPRHAQARCLWRSHPEQTTTARPSTAAQRGISPNRGAATGFHQLGVMAPLAVSDDTVQRRTRRRTTPRAVLTECGGGDGPRRIRRARIRVPLRRVDSPVGGNRARRWTPTQQPPESPSSSEGGKWPKALPRRNAEKLAVNATSAKPATTSFLILQLRYFYYEKETKHLRKPKAKKLAGAFDALFSLMCVRSITRGSLFIGGPRV
jgi:hypothetical protein